MYVHIGIIGRDKTTQLSLALFVIVSDSVTLGERAYNKWARPRLLTAGATFLGHARAVVQLLLQQFAKWDPL